jgi:putative aldouronate transport system substrate-binding protein
MKKAFSMLAISLAVLLALTGFVNIKSTAKGEPYTVKIAWLILTNQPSDLQMVEGAINKITLEKINVKVKLMPIPMASWFNQTNLMMSSGEKLDLSIVYNKGGIFSTNVTSGKLMPIDNLLTKYGGGIKYAISTISPKYLKPGTINGKTYGVTQLRDLATESGLCIRKDIADKIGINPKKRLTVSRLEGYLKVAKEMYPNMSPLVPFNVGGSVGSALYSWDNLGDNMGVLSNFGMNDTKIVDQFETPEYAKLINTMYNWYQKGYIMPDASTNTTNGVGLVKSNKGIGFITSMKPGFANQETLQIGYKMETINMTNPVSNSTQVNNFLWTIPTNCKDPVSAMKMLNLMYTDKNIINLLTWGVEGKHYIRIKENPNIITYPAGVTSTNRGWGLNLGWEMGNQFLSYIWKGDSPDLYKQLTEFDKNAKISKAMGFVFDPSSVKPQVAAVSNVISQYKTALENGELDPAVALPKFISDLKANGINNIIEEKQKQLDIFLKSKY